MKKRVMGQDEAIHLVSEAIIKSRSGIKDPNRPIGSFIFLGPTGVVKQKWLEHLPMNCLMMRSIWFVLI